MVAKCEVGHSAIETMLTAIASVPDLQEYSQEILIKFRILSDFAWQEDSLTLND